MQAYRREVQESNLQHALSCYLLDSDLHAFVRGLLESLTERTNQLLHRLTLNNHQFSGAVGSRHLWSPLDTLDDLPLRTIQFSCHFLLDVVLHCRERAAMRSSINCLKAAFETYLPSRRRVVHQSHRRQQQLLVVRGLHPVLLRCIGEGHICSDPCTSCYCSGSEG